MTVSFELSAEPREQHGKAHARRMRRIDNKVPAVIYGAGKEPQSITLDHNEIKHALDQEATYSHILTVKVGSASEKVVLKKIQRHAYKPRILHVDFLRVKMKEKITMLVPLHFVGEEEAPGLNEGGAIFKNVSEIEISCLPGDLPEHIDVDVSGMKLDEAIHLSELKLPNGVELKNQELDEEHDQAVVSLHVPKVSKEDLAAEAAEAELAEAQAADEEGGEAAKAEAADGDKAESEGDAAKDEKAEGDKADADKKE